MREKGHQNWPLVIGPRYDPHLPFSGRSVSKPWSKRDTSSKHSPFPRDECPSLSHCNHFLWARKPRTKACLFPPDRRECRKRNTTHIYEIIWHLVFHYNERKNCLRPRGVETCDTRKWFGAVTLLSEREECIFLAGGETQDDDDAAVEKYGRTVWNQRGERSHMLRL